MPVSFPHQRAGLPKYDCNVSDRRISVLKKTPIETLNTREACKAFRYNFTYMGPRDSIKNAFNSFAKSDALNDACLCHLYSFPDGRAYLKSTGELQEAAEAGRAILGAMSEDDRTKLLESKSIEPDTSTNSSWIVLTHPDTGLRLSIPADVFLEKKEQDKEVSAWKMALQDIPEREILDQYVEDNKTRILVSVLYDPDSNASGSIANSSIVI